MVGVRASVDVAARVSDDGAASMRAATHVPHGTQRGDDWQHSSDCADGNIGSICSAADAHTLLARHAGADASTAEAAAVWERCAISVDIHALAPPLSETP